MADNNLPDGFRETPLGPLPQEWKVARLGDVLEEVDRRVRDFHGEADSLPVLSLTKNQGLMLQAERFGKRIATEDVSDYKVVHRGQIVHNPYVIWEGAVHILKDFESGLVSPVYPVWQARADKADAFFVDPLLRMPAAIAGYNRFASGAVNRRRAIRKKDFLSMEIPLPPLAEQRAIAGVLATVQRAIAATEQVIATARELKRALMRHLFTYGPVAVGESGRVVLRETEIGPVPEQWEVVSLGDVADLARKSGARGITEAALIPFIPMSLLPTDALYATEWEVRQSADVRSGMPVRTGDLLLAKITPCFENGKQGIVGPIPGGWGYATTEVIPIRATSSLDIEYLAMLLSVPSVRRSLASKMEGTTGRQRLPKTVVQVLPLPLPPLPEQREIVRRLVAVDRKIAAEDARKASLEDLFETLLHHLMTGRVRVPPALMKEEST